MASLTVGWASSQTILILGKTLYSHSASLHPGVEMGTIEPGAQGELNAGVL